MIGMQHATLIRSPFTGQVIGYHRQKQAQKKVHGGGVESGDWRHRQEVSRLVSQDLWEFL